MTNPRPKAAATAIILWACLVASFLLTPAPGDATVCVLRATTGLKCPGCGMGHAFVALSAGRWDEAARENILSLLLYPLFWAGAIVYSARAAGYDLPVPALSQRAFIGVALTILGLWFLRLGGLW